MTRNKPLVVIDTNIFISAVLLPDSIPDSIVRGWKDNKFELVISSQIVNEIQNVCMRPHIAAKYHLSSNLLLTFRTSAIWGESMAISEMPIRCRDPKDNYILGLALGAQADYLVTGDSDLLVLRDALEIKPLCICTAKEFLDTISA